MLPSALPTKVIYSCLVICVCLASGCAEMGGTGASVPKGTSRQTSSAAPVKGSQAPEGLTAKLAGRNTIKLAWKDEFRDAGGYAIERSDGSETLEIARVTSDTCEFDDIRLSPSTTYTYRIRAYNSFAYSPYSKPCTVSTSTLCGPVIVDHTCTDLSSIPVYRIKGAKKALHIAYGHSSYGGQLTAGMYGLAQFRGDLFSFAGGDMEGGALDLRDCPFKGAKDLSTPDRSAWERSTREYLKGNPEINVVVWAWGSGADASYADIERYLSLMEGLERDYPHVMFVYMTGRLDGKGLNGNLHQRNEQIRDFCRSRGKILYDFADIESYDPDGVCYLARFADSGCYIDSDLDGARDENWAITWQEKHVEGQDWFDCPSPRTKPLNANLKAYAAWWLWARLTGWDEG